ncbi:MAG: ribosomal RNA small subunit methyltransferase A, partial [Acidobacteria bacterium]
MGLRQRAPGPDRHIPAAERGGLRHRGRGRHQHRRDVDPRGGSLLRPRRRGTRGDRGTLLAAQAPGRSRRRRGRGLRPRKRFAQHFLEPPWVAKLVEAVAPRPADVFLEIGPGTGALTRPLASRTALVLAVEIDRDLAARLRLTLPANVEVVEGDILEVDLRRLASRGATEAAGEERPAPIRVVGNLPYNISSPILFRLLALNEERQAWSDATLMVQEEVADRMVAAPGGKNYGVLAILVGVGAAATRLFTLPPGACRPMPRVRSAVVRLEARPAPEGLDLRAFEAFVRHLFMQRRKTLLNRLAPGWPCGKEAAARAMAKAGVDP